MSGSGHNRPGTRVGPYRIEGPLGRGGMGEVVVAYDERLDRRVAIKRIRHVDSRDPGAARERLRREARAAAGLNHPSIVQIHDILEDANDDAIVMEWVEGRSVAQCLEQGPFAVHEVLHLGRQVAEGLAEAHRAGLLHRDLKAENVMVIPATDDHPARAKILDFGLVKKMLRSSSDETPLERDGDQSLTRKGAVIGTARAMSPEQAVGATLDRRSDLFSLGVLLYEMLTGRSPFRGSTPAETMRRLLVDTPRPLDELRRDIPVAFESLIEALLEKEPDRRPRDADQVVEILAGLAARTPDSKDSNNRPTIEGSLGDLSTGSYDGTPRTERSAPPVPTEPATEHRPNKGLRRWHGRWRPAALTLGSIVILSVLAVFAWTRRQKSIEPIDTLRVVVLRPEVAGSRTADSEFLASGVHIAILTQLAALEGIAPVETSLGNEAARTPRDAARAEAADEVVTARVEGQAGNARVALQRIRGVDGEVVWATAFDAPLRPADAFVVAEAVSVQLQRAYPARAVPAGANKRVVPDEAYVDFIETLQRIESGEVSLEPELARLEAISARAPHFMAAHLRGVSAAWALHTDTRDPHYLKRAEALLDFARTRAPDDPQPWYWTFRLALGRGARDAAEHALHKLIEVAPNDTNIARCRVSLAEHDGDLGAAVLAMRSVVERVPSWQNLYRLAGLEQRRGNIVEARAQLEQLVERLPANTWALAKLARLELFYGDLSRAVELYRQTIELKPHRSYFTNLGLASFLLGRFADASDNYQQALALQPGHLITRLNLADAESAQGDTGSAQARYQQIAKELESRDLNAAERMTLAQCLAQVGDAKRAVAITLETLKAHPDDLEVVYQAALVYALVGDLASALANAQRALDRGYPPRWFGIPDFELLRADPRFLSLVNDRV